jgi:hypothetical protein
MMIDGGGAAGVRRVNEVWIMRRSGTERAK